MGNCTYTELSTNSLLLRYHLQPDVRESLYGYCRQWKKAIGPHQRFLGGDQPNLADLVSMLFYVQILYLLQQL